MRHLFRIGQTALPLARAGGNMAYRTPVMQIPLSIIQTEGYVFPARLSIPLYFFFFFLPCHAQYPPLPFFFFFDSFILPPHDEKQDRFITLVLYAHLLFFFFTCIYVNNSPMAHLAPNTTPYFETPRLRTFLTGDGGGAHLPQVAVRRGGPFPTGGLALAKGLIFDAGFGWIIDDR